ncbi:MAG: M28 family peptidase [Acidobacteriia bacterium]|nr:M28 family peptidase [Terriglobia bacterium]
MRRLVPVFCALLVLFPLAGVAQQSPFLPEETYDKLVNEISGDIAFDNLRSLVMYHSPSAGAEDFPKEAQWVVERAQSYGLEEVRFIPLPAWHADPKAADLNWTLKSGELWLLEPKEIKIGDVRETPVSVADNSPSADITAELVDVGEGIADSDYAGKGVTGKVVLAYGRIDKVKIKACWDHGAVAIVSYYSSRVSPWTDYPDQVAWARVGRSKEGEKPNPPVFMVSPRTGLMLSRWMAGRAPTHIFSEEPEATSPPPIFKVHLKIQSELTEPERSGMVEGFIRGTTYHDQAVVLTAHLQEEKTSANDDRSGCANLLEIARALEAMIAEGRLPRPQRDIRFWWTDEIAAEYQYFSDHPEERKHIIADINQDMVGARQSLGGRVQHVSRTPWSRWSFLNDVVESIVTSLVRGNNAYLASWQNKNPAPFSRPILAHLGSREPYNSEVVPYFDSTDHLVFNESAVSIPGVTLTNWPDEYIHSSDDDLWQIDQTQLQRNAVAVAATALYLANLSGADVPTLTAVMAGEARERISRDLATGLSRLAQAPAADQRAAYDDALNLLGQAVARETAGLESLRRFADAGSLKLLDSLIADFKLTELNHRKRIDEWFLALGGKKTSAMLAEREAALATKVPRNLGTPGEYLRAKERVEGPKTLHGLMAWEALNFVDGKRSLLDIYRIVRGESLSAGEWYYGKVTPEDIEALFTAAEKEKAVAIATPAPPMRH